MRFSIALFRLSVITTVACALFAGCKNETIITEPGTIIINAPVKEKENPDSLPLRSRLFHRVDTILLQSDVVEGCMNTINDVKATDDYIFVLTQDDERMLVYDKDGWFIRQIGRRGRGHGEYISARSFDILPEKEEIYLCGEFADEITVYSFSGEFRRKISTQCMALDFAVKSDGHMLFFTEYGGAKTNYQRGVFETDADGNFLKMIYALPDDYNYYRNYKVFTHISADEIGCMGFEDEDYIYHIKGDSVYKPYRIKTDIKMDEKVLRERQRYPSDNTYYKGLYRESENNLTVSILGVENIVRIYYDKINHSTYRSIDFSGVDVPVDEQFLPFTSSFRGRWIRVLDVLNIHYVPELDQAFPDITAESNPVILIFQ